MKEYLDMADFVLKNGTYKENRTGVPTLSVFNYSYTINLQNGFPILTTKKVSWKAVVIELLWFLSGQTNASFLDKHNVKFWRPWTDKNNEVDAHYGKGWRAYPGVDYNGNVVETDQIRFIIDTLKKDPYSRRMVCTPWNPPRAKVASLPPCHAFWTVNVQNDKSGNKSLCLSLQQRSGDLGTGIGINISSYALLMHMLSRFSGIPVGLFGHNITDLHIYCSKPDGTLSEYDHRPGMYEQLKRQPMILPKLTICDSIKCLEDVEDLIKNADTETIMSKFVLTGYDPYDPIPLKAAV